MYRCEYCLSERFLTKEKLFNHIEKCKNNNKCIDEVLPEEGKNILKFQNNNNKFMHPFYIAADFESTLEPVNETNDDNTVKYQKHVPNSSNINQFLFNINVMLLITLTPKSFNRLIFLHNINEHYFLSCIHNYKLPK